MTITQQKEQLAQWRINNHEKVQGMMMKVKTLEDNIKAASLDGVSKEKIMQLATEIMQARTAVIATKTDCRDNLKRVLNQHQHRQMIDLYKNMEKSRQSKMKSMH